MLSTIQEIVFRIRAVHDVLCAKSCAREMCNQCRVCAPLLVSRQCPAVFFFMFRHFSCSSLIFQVFSLFHCFYLFPLPCAFESQPWLSFFHLHVSHVAGLFGIAAPAGRNAMHHAGGELMPIERQSRMWQLVPCSERMIEDIDASEKTADILRHQKDRHEEDGARSWAAYKIIITAEMPNMRNVCPYRWLTQLTISTDEERYDICWPAGGNLMLRSETRMRKQNGLFVESGNPGALRRKSSTRVQLAADPRVRRQRAPPQQPRKAQNKNIKDKRGIACPLGVLLALGRLDSEERSLAGSSSEASKKLPDTRGL